MKLKEILFTSLLLVIILGGCATKEIRDKNISNDVNYHKNSADEVRVIDVEKLGLTSRQLTEYKKLTTAENKVDYLKSLGMISNLINQPASDNMETRIGIQP